MALTKCPQCGNDISDKAERCPKCGYVMSENSGFKSEHEVVSEEIDYCSNTCGEEGKEHQSSFSTSENSKITNRNHGMSRAKACKISKVLCIIFLCFSLFFLFKAIDKKNNYSNPSSDGYHYSRQYINTYVGGDAYNYIINGTYFAGYSVLGMGALIISSITGVTYLKLAVDESEDGKEK